MNKELSKTYNPKDFEDKWYDFWLKNGYFKPRKGKKNETFTIVIPPPNVTAVLHMGHGLNNTIQDILIRYKECVAMKPSGYRNRSCRHRDTKCRRKELAEEGKKRTDFTREALSKGYGKLLIRIRNQLYHN